MSPTFYLRDPRSKALTLLYYQINIYGFRIRHPLGIKVLPHTWISKYEEVKPDTQESIKINLYLAELRAKTSRAILDYKLQSIVPSKQQFIESIFGSEKNTDNVFDRVDEFIIEHRKRTRTDSYKAIRTAINNFKKFRPHCQVPENSDLEDFAKHLISKLHNPNYVRDQIDRLVRFCRWAGLNLKVKTGIKPVKSESFVYLTPEEISRIATCNVLVHLEPHRDTFLFALDTGMRYEDILLFKKSWVVKVQGPAGQVTECISYIPHKTQTRAVVPVFEYAQKVLKKYNGDLPPRISEQKYRIAIKQICAAARINQEVTIIYNRGKIVETEQVPKYQAVACRTAKRSFVTNMLNSGRDIREVALMTGNTQRQILTLYDRLLPEQNALNVARLMKK